MEVRTNYGLTGSGLAFSCPTPNDPQQSQKPIHSWCLVKQLLLMTAAILMAPGQSSTNEHMFKLFLESNVANLQDIVHRTLLIRCLLRKNHLIGEDWEMVLRPDSDDRESRESGSFLHW